jgi:hypothetical protein
MIRPPTPYGSCSSVWWIRVELWVLALGLALPWLARMSITLRRSSEASGLGPTPGGMAPARRRNADCAAASSPRRRSESPLGRHGPGSGGPAARRARVLLSDPAAAAPRRRADPRPGTASPPGLDDRARPSRHDRPKDRRRPAPRPREDESAVARIVQDALRAELLTPAELEDSVRSHAAAYGAPSGSAMAVALTGTTRGSEIGGAV